MADTNARAALMRLRDKVHAEWQKPPAPSPNSPADVWYRHFCRMIDSELAALPADEAAGACDLVAEERAKLVRRVGSDCCNGTDPACGGGCLFERAVRNLDMGAERARKPQPDERDKTILDMLQMHNDTERVLDEFGLLHDVKAALPDQVRAVCKEVVELREKLRQSEEIINSQVGVCSEHCVLIDELKERAEKAEAEAARYRETLVSKHGGEPLALLDELDEARAQLAEARKAGLRELREQVEHDATSSPAPSAGSYAETWYRYFLRLIDDRLLAADPHHPTSGDTGVGCGDTDDATLRDWVRIVDGSDQSDVRDEALAELCRRALGVTGGGRKEVGDG